MIGVFLVIHLYSGLSFCLTNLDVHHWDCLNYIPPLPRTMVSLEKYQTQRFVADISSLYWNDKIVYLNYVGVFLKQFSGAANLYWKKVFHNQTEYDEYRTMSNTQKEEFLQQIYASTPLQQYDSKFACNFLHESTEQCYILEMEPYEVGTFNQVFLFAIESMDDSTTFETIHAVETSPLSKSSCIFMVRFYKGISTVVTFGIIVTCWFITFAFTAIVCIIMLALYFLKGRITMQKTKDFYANMFGTTTTTNQRNLLQED